MKRICFSCLLFFILACKSPADNEKDEAAENDLDAAISFVQAVLKGQYGKARDFMLQDAANGQLLDSASRVQLSSHEKQGLWDASINIHNRKLINDSTSIIVYSNSFQKTIKDTVKVLRVNGKWVVDYKHLIVKNPSDI